MLKLTKLAFIGSVFALAATQAVAVEANRSIQATGNTLPVVDCSNGAGNCFFKDLKDWHNGTGQAAYYYCLPPEGPGTFRMENHSVLITGFDKDGILEGSFDDLRKYSYGAYKDPDKFFISWVAIINKATGKGIQCYEGRGNPERPVMQNQANGPGLAPPRF